MGYGADVAEFAADHGITDFDLAFEMYNDPGGDFDDFPADDDDDDGVGDEAGSEPDGDSPGSGHPVQPSHHVRQARRSRSRGREVCRHWLRGSQNQPASSGSGRLSASGAVPDQISVEAGRMEKTLAVQRQCHLRGKTMEDFTAACDIVSFKDDPLAGADSGEEVVQNVFERLDAEARRQNTSSDALLAKKKAECAVQ